MPPASSRITSYVVLLVLTLLVAGAGPASAHAALLSSDPGDGASIAFAPASLALTFNEDISAPAFVAATAPDGGAVAVADVSVDGAVVTATLAGGDQRGRYTVSYRVVSTDGHPVEGGILFTTTTGRKVTQAEPASDRTFMHRYSGHLFWAILAAAVLIGLLLVPLRRPNGEEVL